MPINILIAPPASGKTTYCVRRVVEINKTSPYTDVWVLVPDGYQAKAFRRKMAENGGGLGVNVVTFDNLLREILEETGSSVSLAPTILGQAFIRNAIDTIYQQGVLTHFEAIRDTSGFISALQERFAELKRGLIYPEKFLEYAQDQIPAVKELALIYDAYQRLLIENNWADPAGLSWLAIEFIETHPEWKPDWPLLVLDGFDSFTKPQIKALNLLSDRIPEILVTLPGTVDMNRQAHQRFADTLQELFSLEEAKPISLELLPHLPKVLSHLEANFGKGIIQPQLSEGQISLMEARSPAEEAREALRWLKTLIVRGDIALQSCAVIVPDPTTYHPHLRAVADEFGLPMEFSVGQRLYETPLFAALESMLLLFPQDFPRRLVLDTIRSPYFNLETYGLTPREANTLNLLSQTQQVIGGRQVWLDTLEALKTKPEDEEAWSDEEEFTAPRPPAGTTATRLQQALKDFFNRISPPEDRRSLIEWVTWLEDLLEEISFWQEPELEADANAQATLRQMLRELVLTETVSGIREYPYQAFWEILSESARRTVVVSPSWTNNPAIKVLRTVEGRGLRHDAVVIVGLSEGIFPRPQKADPFLPETLRKDLGLESAFDQHQLGLFYQAITRADRQLLLTRPFLSPDGETWEPSPFWEEVRRLFFDGHQKIIGDGERALSDAGSPPELLAWATYQARITSSLKENLSDRVHRVLHGRHVVESRLSGADLNVYNGDLSDQAGKTGEVNVSGKIWSASRLESYLSCPHFYFASKVLELEAQQEPGLGMDVAQRGSIMHQILERVFQESETPTDLDSLLDTLRIVSEEVLANAPNEYGFRPTPLWTQEKSEIQARLETTITNLHEESVGWTPLAFEMPFGLKDRPPLTLNLVAGLINLRGFIDRVDQDNQGNLRIIDYKLGSSKLGERDLEEGTRIQLPIYGLAARDALGLGEPKDGFYWAINQAKPSPLKLEKYGFREAVKVSLEHINTAIDGISKAHFKPAAPKGGCPGYCPAAGWCWAYEPQGSW